MKIISFITVIIIINLSCAPFLQSSRTEYYSNTLNILIGKANRDQIIGKFGPPYNKLLFDEKEIWLYKFQIPEDSYNAFDKNPDGSYPTLYDYIKIYFDSNNIMCNWELLVAP